MGRCGQFPYESLNLVCLLFDAGTGVEVLVDHIGL